MMSYDKYACNKSFNYMKNQQQRKKKRRERKRYLRVLYFLFYNGHSLSNQF